MAHGSKERPTLARKLNKLFDEIRPDGRNGRRYTNDEVAAAIKAAAPGVRVGGAYLSALRTGIKRQPSVELRVALARFFGVSSAYFVEETTPEQTETEIALAKVASNLGVRNLALRALELSPEGLAAVANVIEQVLKSDRQAETKQRSRSKTRPGHE